MIRYFGISGLLTFIAVAVVLFTLGFSSALTVIVLIAIEIAFSVDNAIINAKVLERLSHKWQQLFLTLGVVFAIVAMRLVFPVLIVVISAGLSWSEVVNEALHNPSQYSAHLVAAHTTIAAYGGGFLLTLALFFLLDEERKIVWLENIERPLQKLGGNIWLTPLIALIVVFFTGLGSDAVPAEVWRPGVLGIASYLTIKLVIDGLDKLAPQENKIYTGWSAFLAFMYLQLLDASFSLDGVLGAFAITSKILLIVLGLGVGAAWVRSLTVYLVRRKTLNSYIYLEHGAHYAILFLAIALMSSLLFDVPDAVTGIAGLGIIAASFIASRQALLNKR
ncbi:MAG TPA: DUF475 domain-containing protein [Candidatus Saccharimonadales bacterium]|nr:DUF475 domain-containing protein [Candidatus Saccharimonadales bacterium]